MRPSTRKRRVVALVDSMSGLVTRFVRRQRHALDLALAGQRQQFCAGELGRYTPALSCYRSVSQRSLSIHSTFLSDNVVEDWGVQFALPVQSILETLLTSASGAMPPPAGEDSLRFWDANGPDRGRVAGMVLIGVRSKVSAQVIFESLPNAIGGVHVNSGPLVETLKDFVRDYVAISLFASGDSIVKTDTVVASSPPDKLGDPWIGFTPLRYFDREDGDFQPVPPLMWRGRDPNARIMVQKGQFGPGQNLQYQNQRVPVLNSATPTGASTIDQNFRAVLSLIVEGLFVPNPAQCGDAWPGELCPTHKIGNHPDYTPELPSYMPPAEDLEPRALPSSPSSRECSNCSVSHEDSTPSPFGILDPRHNVRRCVKEMLNLEDHIFLPGEWCNDCVHKHSLKIESLGEEGVSLDKGGTEAGELCRKAANIGRSAWQRIQAGEDRARVGDDLRAFRKTLTKKVRQWEDEKS